MSGLQNKIIQAMLLLMFLSCYTSAYGSSPEINNDMTYTYESRKNQGEKLSLTQLFSLKDKLLKQIDLYPSDNEYLLLHETSGIVLLGLYFKDKEIAIDFLNEVKENLNKYFEKRGDSQWKRDDKNDRFFLQKFTLYGNLLEETLLVSIIDKNYELCIKIINENRDSPFIQARRIVVKYLLRLYNVNDLTIELKQNLEKIFDDMIERESIAIEEKNDQEDSIRSRSGSKSLLKVLKNRNDSSAGFSID